jgi:hypothetical protein
MKLTQDILKLRDVLPRTRQPEIVQVKLEDLIDQLIPTPKIRLRKDGWIMDIIREKK